MGLQLQPQLNPLTLGLPGLPLRRIEPSAGRGTPRLPLTWSLWQEPGSFPELVHGRLSSEGLIVREIQPNYQAPMSRFQDYLVQ